MKPHQKSRNPINKEQGSLGKRADPLPESELAELIGLFHARRYSEMESRARVLIGRYAHSGEAWRAFGIALQYQNKDALQALQRTAELLPGDATAHNSLGDVLRSLGRLEEAEACYRRTLEITPGFGAAHGNLGNVLRDLGRMKEAEASYRRALEIEPGLTFAHNNLGIALKNLGRLEEAVASYRRALEIDPLYAAAYSNLGNALSDLGQPEEAETSFRKALEIEPNLAVVHSNLGNTLRDLGRQDEALASCRRALEIDPNYALAYSNLGNVLKDLGRLEKAEASFRRALEIDPNYALAHSNLGVVLKQRGRLVEAIGSFRRAVEIDPNLAIVHRNLGIALKALGHLEEAEASFRRALEIDPEFDEALGNLLFTHNYLPDQPAETLLADARHYGELVVRKAHPYTHWSNHPDPDRCLRVGLVSGDLREHAVGYFLEGVLAALANHAARRIELFGYPTDAKYDSVTERIRASCHGWCQADRLSDQLLAERVRDDGIDILIDLSGHSAYNRLPVFAWKPSPVQVTWLGYFATTGVAAIDYLIADPWTLPESEDAYYTEKIWRLPETRLCFTPPDVAIEVSPLPALTAGRLTFGCFNNLTKINDNVVALWARVMHAVTGSRLFLKAPQLDDASVRQETFDRFAAQGVAEQQLILEGWSSRSEYLAAYHRIDIALDPFPYTGGTTSAESLWMGVPVLTLAGDRFISRQGVGLMMNADLSEWVAADGDDYVTRAESHSDDLQQLATLRQGLRRQVLSSPLFDAHRFARHLETALRGMWAKWCSPD